MSSTTNYYVFFIKLSQGFFHGVYMKVFIVNIASSHPVVDVIRKYASTAVLPEWPKDLFSIYKEKSLVFAKVDSEEMIIEITKACEENDQWCFFWSDKRFLPSIMNQVSTKLIDFIAGEYDENEIHLRFIRLLKLKHTGIMTNFFDMPKKIADELTKNQLMLFDELLKAGSDGVKKKVLAARLWNNPTESYVRKSGFNVHLHHLRKKIKNHGYSIVFNSQSNNYILTQNSGSL